MPRPRGVLALSRVNLASPAKWMPLQSLSQTFLERVHHSATFARPGIDIRLAPLPVQANPANEEPVLDHICRRPLQLSGWESSSFGLPLSGGTCTEIRTNPSGVSRRIPLSPIYGR